MRKKAKILKDYANRLANNDLSDLEYAMWATGYRRYDARIFLEVYNDGNKKIPFRQWLNALILKGL